MASKLEETKKKYEKKLKQIELQEDIKKKKEELKKLRESK